AGSSPRRRRPRPRRAPPPAKRPPPPPPPRPRAPPEPTKSPVENASAFQRVAKAPRSRGNPFLPAAQDRNSFPLVVAVPCFCCARRSGLAKGRPLPLLRFGCFVRRTRLSFAVPGDKIER